MRAVRQAVGRDFLFGVRLSAKDFNYLPINIRWPLFPLRHYFVGNDLPETTYMRAGWSSLASTISISTAASVSPIPRAAREYPDEGFSNFVNATRHLSGKARARAAVFNIVPPAVRKKVFGLGCRFQPAANADFAAAIRRVVSSPSSPMAVFRIARVINHALNSRKCDMVAIARPLLANPDLLEQFSSADKPAEPVLLLYALLFADRRLPAGLLRSASLSIRRSR